jgi:hypothetical protein
MGNIAEYIYGEEYAEKNQAFAEELSRLEDRHQDFFKNRPAPNETDQQDRLHYHVVIRTAGGQISLNFSEGSDLPPELRQEVTDAFHRIWKYA